MTININTAKKIANLAHIDQSDAEKLFTRISNTLHGIDMLTQVDTTNIEPCIHPSVSSQYLRDDIVTNNNYKNELANIAPLFAEDSFLVPNILLKGE